MDKKNAKYDAESLAGWLARETGHTDVPEEGYGEEKKPLDLPAKRRKDMGAFFDGLHVEKALTEKRRQSAVDEIDDLQAIKDSITPKGMY